MSTGHKTSRRDRGKLLCSYGAYRLLPVEDFAGFRLPEPWIPDSIGHHREWIGACKTRGETTSNFDYSGALTETVLLGNVAFRTGHPLEWDAEKLRVTSCRLAQGLIPREYREGWML